MMGPVNIVQCPSRLSSSSSSNLCFTFGTYPPLQHISLDWCFSSATWPDAASRSCVGRGAAGVSRLRYCSFVCGLLLWSASGGDHLCADGDERQERHLSHSVGRPCWARRFDLFHELAVAPSPARSASRSEVCTPACVPKGT